MQRVVFNMEKKLLRLKLNPNKNYMTVSFPKLRIMTMQTANLFFIDRQLILKESEEFFKSYKTTIYLM